MGSPASRGAFLVPVLCAALLHAGCTARIPVRFLDPVGATVTLAPSGHPADGRDGTIPFKEELAPGPWDVVLRVPEAPGVEPCTILGVLVVEEPDRGGAAEPAEFRLDPGQVADAAFGWEVTAEWLLGLRGGIRFKGSVAGVTVEDPEVASWLAPPEGATPEVAGEEGPPEYIPGDVGESYAVAEEPGGFWHAVGEGCVTFLEFVGIVVILAFILAIEICSDSEPEEDW